MTRRAATWLVGLVVAAVAGPPATPAEPSAQSFFRRPHVSAVQLNASGDLYVGLFTRYALTRVRVGGPGRGVHAQIYRFIDEADSAIQTLRWVGNRSLIVTTNDDKVRDVLRVEASADAIELESARIRWPGQLVHPLPHDEVHVMWSPHADRRSVYRVSLEALTGAEDPFRRSARVAQMVVPVDTWYADATGRPKLAVVESPRGASFWYATGGLLGWWPVNEGEESWESWIYPIGLDPKGRVIVASPRGTGRLALYRYAPKEAERLDLALQDPRRDLFDVFRNELTGQIEAGYLFERGVPRFRFLDPDMSRRWTELRGRFEAEIVLPLSHTLDARRWVLSVADAGRPGRIVISSEDGGVEEIGEPLPGTRQAALGRVEVVEVEVPGVGTIEGYLTLPTLGERRPPLILYPHGGPIGVSDQPLFHPGVQFLAARGFAVLQVNYRGSSGFGLDFQRAGFREWGRGIEDDIDAVYEAVMAREVVDDYRVCVIGESYGGYSALMSVIRHPKRFRCAVSTAGVTDIGLMFTTADWSAVEELRDLQAEIVGDPNADYEEMKRFSPVYRAREIRTPLLIIHGADDWRVDVEHAHRLATMLRVLGKEHRLEVVPGLGHGGWSYRQVRAYYQQVADFLDWHLD